MNKDQLTIDKINLPKTYVVTATKQDKRVFYAIDRQSGYPYWSNYLFNSKEWTDLDEAIKAYEDAISSTSYMADGDAINLGVMHKSIEFDTVTSEMIASEQRKKALEKLTDNEKLVLGLV